MKKSLLSLFFLGMIMQNGFAGGTFIDWAYMGTPKYGFSLGDKLNQNILFGANWDATNSPWVVSSGFGKTTDGSGWSWYGATYDSFSAGLYRWNFAQNSHTFSSTGNWYYSGRFNNSTYFEYASAEWAIDRTTLSASKYCEVYNLGNPTNTYVVSANPEKTSAIVGWIVSTDGAQSHKIMVVRILAGGSFTEPIQGTPYTTTIGSGVVVYNGTELSFTDTGLTTGANYVYKVYSKNNNYYSSGVEVYATSTGIGSQSTATQTQCINGTFSPISVTASGVGPFTYQWYSNTSAVASGGTNLGSGNGAQTNTYTPQATSAGTLYYFCIVHGAYGPDVSCTISGAFTVYANPTLGTLSNAGPINFSNSGGDWTAAGPVSVSGQTGTVYWEYGSSNGTWNAWLPGTSPGYCCFPKKTAASDGNPDRIRYYVTNGSCSATSYSSAILIQNRYNEAPTSLGTSASTVCHGTSVTLTATFPTAINIFGTVEFATTCGGAPFASVTAGDNVTSVSTTVAPPDGTTTYYVRYNPGASLTPTACASVAVTATANLSAVAVTSATAQTICATGTGTQLTATETGGGTISSRAWGKRSSSGGAITALGVTTQTYTPTGAGLGAGTWYIVCTSTPTCGSAVVSNEVTVTVNATTAITGQSTATQTTNIAGSFSPISVTATGAGLSYQWYSHTTSSNSGGSPLGSSNGAQTANYTPQPGSAGTKYYYCVVTGACSSATSAVSGAFISISSYNVSGGSTNVSTLPTCSLCDVTVANDGVLVFDQTRTYNNLTVAGGGKVNLNNNYNLTVNNFTLNSDVTNGTATFVDDNANGGLTVLGTTTVNQSFQHPAGALRTWYVTPSVASASPTGMSIIKSYDEPTNTWSSSLTTMNAKVGYQVVPAAAANNISFTGALNNTPQNITLTSRTGIVNKAGFNLIGNPYPSYLDWILVTANASNTALMRSTTMWYRTKSAGVYSFSTVNGAGVSSPIGVSSKIPPMQAFWVRANSGGGTLALTNAMRSHAPATDKLLKAPAAESASNTLVRLQVSNETNTDETVIYFSADASNGIDAYDSPKMSNDNVAIPEIYTTLGTEQIVINGMNSIPLDTPIGLGFVAGNACSFSITANEVSNLPSDLKVILKDNITKAETDLTDGVATYQFCPAVTSSERFSVIFRASGAVAGLENTQVNNIIVYNNAPQQLTVICNDILNLGSMVSVYNAIGQKLINQKLTTTSMQIAGKFISGVYVVKVNNTSKKVIIN